MVRQERHEQRHSFLTEVHQNASKSVAKKMDIAKKMGHSVVTSMTYSQHLT